MTCAALWWDLEAEWLALVPETNHLRAVPAQSPHQFRHFAAGHEAIIALSQTSGGRYARRRRARS